MRSRPLQFGVVGWAWCLGWAAMAIAAGSNEPVSISPTWDVSAPAARGSHTTLLRSGDGVVPINGTGAWWDASGKFSSGLRGTDWFWGLAQDPGLGSSSVRGPVATEYKHGLFSAGSPQTSVPELPANPLLRHVPQVTGQHPGLIDRQQVNSEPAVPRPLHRSRSLRDEAPAMLAGKLPGGSSWVLKTLVALGVVLALILLLRWALNCISGRVSTSANSGVLDVLGRVKIAPRCNILLIRLGHRLLVVSESAAGLSTLADINDPEEVATLLQVLSMSRPHSATSAFSSLLRRFSVEHRDTDRIAVEGDDSEEYHLDRARDQVSGLRARVRNTISSGGGR